MKKENKIQRTDILKGDNAAAFAIMHADVENPTSEAFQLPHCGLMKSLEKNEYYVVKIAMSKDNSSYMIDTFRTEPIKLAGIDLSKVVQRNLYGVDVEALIDGKSKKLYFNRELFPFESIEERDNYYGFIYHVMPQQLDIPYKKEEIETIKKYISDENFINMLKEEVKKYIEETKAYSFIERKRCLRKANRILEDFINNGFINE